MEKPKKEYFGTLERIREWKEEQTKKNGMTWDQFAEAVGVSYKGVRRWLNTKNPTPIRRKNLERIAEVMNCDIEYLECKQNIPKKGNKIPLVPLSTVDRYLPLIQELTETTGTRFTYEYDPELLAHGKDIEGSYIEGEYRYKYKTVELEMDFSEMFFLVSINGAEPVRVSEQRLETIVRSIMKKISKEISKEIKFLEEDKEMYPNITKEMDRVNMTAEELAQAVGMDPEDLIEALRGEKDFTFFQASKIKKALGSELLIEELFETKGE